MPAHPAHCSAPALDKSASPTLFFSPHLAASGEYTIDVKLSGSHLPGSPFTVHTSTRMPHPPSCSVSAAAEQKLISRELQTLDVRFRDLHGNVAHAEDIHCYAEPVEVVGLTTYAAELVRAARKKELEATRRAAERSRHLSAASLCSPNPRALTCGHLSRRPSCFLLCAASRAATCARSACPIGSSRTAAWASRTALSRSASLANWLRRGQSPPPSPSRPPVSASARSRDRTMRLRRNAPSAQPLQFLQARLCGS